MNTDGTNPFRLTQHRSLTFHPAWSPDGDRIAYQAWNAEAKDWSIYVMHADGILPRAIVTGEGVYAPAWSPEGSRILARKVKCLAWTDSEPESGPDCFVGRAPPDQRRRGCREPRPPERLRYQRRRRVLDARARDSRRVAFTQLECSWPAAAWSWRPNSHRFLRLFYGQVTQLTEGSSPSWGR